MQYEAKKFYVSVSLNIYEPNIYISDIKYALIKNGRKYICAYKPELTADEKGIFFTTWSQKHYFNTLEDAKLYLINKLNDKIQELSEEIEDISDTIKTIMKYGIIHCNDIPEELPFNNIKAVLSAIRGERNKKRK